MKLKWASEWEKNGNQGIRLRHYQKKNHMEIQQCCLKSSLSSTRNQENNNFYYLPDEWQRNETNKPFEMLSVYLHI